MYKKTLSIENCPLTFISAAVLGENFVAELGTNADLYYYTNNIFKDSAALTLRYVLSESAVVFDCTWATMFYQLPLVMKPLGFLSQ